jgi:glutamine synthetase
VSIFLGDELTAVLDSLENDTPYQAIEKTQMKLGAKVLPRFQRDTTDRNRTSPFAFTGNKFEFRMVGSSDTIADANITLNSIVAEAFCEAADVLEKADDFETACNKLIYETMCEHQRIVFNGNGYSDEWVQEAERRGLPNLHSLVDAVPYLTTDKTVALYEKFGIYTRAELESRAEIRYETYAKVLRIEARTMIHMAGKHYIPAAITYTTRLGQSISAVKAACEDADLSVQKELILKVSGLLAKANQALEALQALSAQVDAMEDVKEMALAYHDKIVPAMAALRAPVDELELLVDKDIWPVPTYGDLMFEV